MDLETQSLEKAYNRLIQDQRKVFIFGVTDRKDGPVIANLLKFFFGKETKVTTGSESEDAINLVEAPKAYLKVTIIR